MIGHRAFTGGERGLSLIELVVAFAIVAVLLALVFNGRSMLTNRRLAGAARKIASDLRVIEQRARTERTCYRTVFDPSALGESYIIQRYNGTVIDAPAGGGGGSVMCPEASWSTTPVFVDDAADSTVSYRMPPRIDLVSTTFAANTVTFSPLGNPTDPGNPNGGTVTIRSDVGQQRQVVVDVLGRVRIPP